MAGIAFFDFDGTLTRRDTLVPWLIGLRGARRMVAASVRCGFVPPPALLPGPDDWRTRVKRALLGRLLKGITVEQAVGTAKAVGRRLEWRPRLVATLESHLRRGDRVVIATGSPTLVVRTILEQRFGLTEVIGTELEVVDGRLTGKLAGPNCTRLAKAALVAQWLADAGDFDRRYGYGNRPHDLPMLAMMDEAQVV